MAVLAVEKQRTVFVLPDTRAGLIAAGVLIHPRAHDAVLDGRGPVVHLREYLDPRFPDEGVQIQLIPVVGAAALFLLGGGEVPIDEGLYLVLALFYRRGILREALARDREKAVRAVDLEAPLLTRALQICLGPHLHRRKGRGYLRVGVQYRKPVQRVRVLVRRGMLVVSLKCRLCFSYAIGASSLSSSMPSISSPGLTFKARARWIIVRAVGGCTPRSSSFIVLRETCGALRARSRWDSLRSSLNLRNAVLLTFNLLSVARWFRHSDPLYLGIDTRPAHFWG